MAILVAAYHAITMLREALITLSEPPFQHFLERTEMNGVFKFSMQTTPNTQYEKRMTELVMCQAHMIHCLEAKLWTTRSRFINLQRRVEPYVRMTAVPSTILYYPQGDDAMVYEVTKYPYCYPEAQGVRVPQSLMRPSRISTGFLVRRMSHTTSTPADLLGDTPVHLLHPEAPGCDGDPMG